MICCNTPRDGISNEIVCEMAGMKKKQEYLRSRNCDGLGMQKEWIMKELQWRQKNLQLMAQRKANLKPGLHEP